MLATVRRRAVVRLFLTTLAIVGWFVVVSDAQATTFTVNTTLDVADPNLADGVCDADPGPAVQCSLRAAIQQANALPAPFQGSPHVVNLPAGTFTLTIPGRDEIASATGDLNMTVANGGLRIVGQGATQTIVRAGTTSTNGIDRVFRVQSGANAFIVELAIEHGTAGQGGSLRSGGGVLNEGTLRLNEVEVRENTANNDPSQAGGGGLANASAATMTVTQSAVLDNVATSNGAGVSNQGTMLLDTVTIARNRTAGAVGAVFSFNAPSTVIRSSTIVENEASSPTGGGLGMFPGSPSFRIANTILDSPVGRNCSNTTTLISEGFNLSSDDTCALTTSGSTPDRINAQPVLGALDTHGGETRNYVPQPASPALDSGGDAPPCGGTTTLDQRGLTRFQVGLGSFGFSTRCDIGAVEVPNLLVPAGSIDAPPVTAPSAACRNATVQCTLRQAVLDGNVYGGASIGLPAGTNGLTRSGRNEDAGLTGDLDVTAPLNVQGGGASGAGATTIQAGTTASNGIDRVFDVRDGGQLILRDLTLRFGQAQGAGAAGEGGAIRAEATPLRLERVVVRDSTAQTSGGGVSSRGSSLSVTATEIRDNTAGTGGGGIFSASGTSIERSTLASNRVTNGAGGGLTLSLAPSLVSSISRTTFSGNQASTSSAIDATVDNTLLQLIRISVVENTNSSASGGAVRLVRSGSASPQIVVRLSLFAENPTPNCQLVGQIDGGNNLSDDATCGIGTASRVNTDPIIGQLRDNGGLTRTHALLPGSPAIDTGEAAPSTGNCGEFDQRGSGPTFNFAGLADGDETAGVVCDLGAFEVQRFAVDTTNDFIDVAPGDGRCARILQGGQGGTACSLRGAIQEANAEGHAVVSMPAGTFTLSLPGSGENSALTGDLDVTVGLTLIGAGGQTTIIQAGAGLTNGIDRVFEIRPGGSARMSRLTIRRGRVSGDGGGILVNSARLALTDVEVAQNSVISSSNRGGGLAATGNSAITTLRRVTLAENVTENRGGGIYADGTMSLENVTLSSNRTNADFAVGGGIYSDATLAINQTTFSGNSAFSGGNGNAIYVNSGTTTVSNSIFVRNNLVSEGPCQVGSGSIVSLGFNKSRAIGNSCTGGATGDQEAANLSLGALANNGGQTRTHALSSLATNDAVDKGNAATPLNGLNGRCAAVDQRNSPRPQDGDAAKGAICDAGAFEVQPSFGSFNVQVAPEKAAPGEIVRVEFTWTLPEPTHWRDLDRLDLQLIGSTGKPVFWLRWTESDDRYILLDEQGKEVGGGTPGSSTVLRTDFATLALADVKTQGSGPTGQTVTLILPFVFTVGATDQTYVVRVSARADDGTEDPFADATIIEIGDAGATTRPQSSSDDGDKPDRPRRPTEEQRQQRERTNASNMDDYRTEGNVIAVHLDETPPSIVIGTRDGPVTLRLRGDAATVKVKVGDYVTAEGEKVTEEIYEIDDLDIE